MQLKRGIRKSLSFVNLKIVSKRFEEVIYWGPRNFEKTQVPLGWPNRYKLAPLRSQILQGPHPSANTSPAWKREETYERKPSYGGGTSHVHAAGVHHYRWHSTWISSLSQATSGTPVSQERRGLLDYDVVDKNQNLICHSENIPPMLKGISFNEESKSQPKRNGLRHRKRTLRTLDFDLVKRYWILHIQLVSSI